MARQLGTTLVLVGFLIEGRMAAQQSPPATGGLSEDLQPHIVGSKGTTMIGFGGYVDRVYSSERVLPLNYTIQIDVSRFVSKRVVVRGGLLGSGSAGGDDAEDRPSGLGAPALHASGGLFYYLKPQSMWSPYGGAEYWTQLTQRAADDRGSLIGTLGLEGAVSRRLGLFMEAGYGIGLTGPDEQTNRLVARVGMRLKF
jgi:hypothetical protein